MLHSCVNIPWDGEGATDADYLYAFQKVVMPIAYEYAPDFVIGKLVFDTFAAFTELEYPLSLCRLRCS